MPPKIAAMDAEALATVFRTPPALHRFPGSMAGKVQALCQAIADDYGNRAETVWTEAATGKDLEARLLGLPGIGAMKARALIVIVGKRFGIKPPGWDEVAPTTPTLGRRGLAGGPRDVPGEQARAEGRRQGRQGLTAPVPPGPLVCRFEGPRVD